jgi:predicted transcriptional regulator
MPILSSEGNRGRRYLSALDGRQLRQLRRQHGLSQEKLADLAGISLTKLELMKLHNHWFYGREDLVV